MDICKNNPNPAILIGGDINAGDINWDENLAESHSQQLLIKCHLCTYIQCCILRVSTYESNTHVMVLVAILLFLLMSV